MASSNRKQSSSPRWNPVRILWMTFVASLVFSVGLVAGQHWLINDGLPHAISVGEASATPEVEAYPTSGQPVSDDLMELDEATELFSFYRALTQSEPQILGDPGAPGRYTLTVDSHSSMEQARAELDHLRSLDLDAHLVASQVDGTAHYTLRISKFSTPDAAEEMAQTLLRRHQIDTQVSPL